MDFKEWFEKNKEQMLKDNLTVEQMLEKAFNDGKDVGYNIGFEIGYNEPIL